MILHDREVGFLRTVGAVSEIAKVCPKEDIAKFGEVLRSNSTVSVNETWTVFVCALSKGYEMSKHFFDKSYEMKPVTPEEISIIDEETFGNLVAEATRAWLGDVQTVEVEEPKKKVEINETSD